MNQTQKKANRVSVFKYWFHIIFPKVRQDIWEYIKEHLALTLVILVGAVITSIFSANGILNKAISEGYISDASSLIRGLGALLVLSVLYLGFGIFYYPVILYRE